MVVSKNLLGYFNQLTKLEAELDLLEKGEKLLCEKGQGDALGELSDDINQCEGKRIGLRRKYYELLNELMKEILCCSTVDMVDLMKKLYDMKAQILTMIKWLCEHQITNEKGELVSCWKQFRRDCPGYAKWDYQD